MEHLLDSETAGTVTMLYRCQNMYDGGDFESYPSRMGWDINALKRDDLHGKTEDEATSFLQAWLYFGLLWDYFGAFDGFDLYQFVREPNETTRVISTKSLAEYVLRWAQEESSKTPEELKKAFEYTKAHLILVYSVANHFCSGFPMNTLSGYKRPKWQLPDDVALSIQILCDTLQHAGFHIYKQRYSMNWGYSPLLVEKMKLDGWCPRAIGTCKHGQHIHMLCYASTLGPPAVVRDHRICTEQRCTWEQIKQETYRTLHKPPCTACVYVGAEEDELKSIYENEETPLFRLDAPTRRYQVAGSKAAGGYTAISHVWADGLGNPGSNKLPFCQVETVQKMVDKLKEKPFPGPTFWWCDTLSIPVGENNKQYRRKSIGNMRWTYSSAAKTLILDSELMHASINDSPVALYLRLKLSSWARRLWTFQESNLSRNAFIQLADGAIRLQDLYKAILQDGQRNRRYLYTRYSMIAAALIPPLLFDDPEISGEPPMFPQIWKQIEWRATSWQSDEAVGMATLMRADANKVLAIDDSDLDGRMAKFFELIKVIPLTLVFQAPPRIARPGFTWAPSTLLTCFRSEPLDTFRYVDGAGIVDGQRGLVIRSNYAVQVRSGFRWSDKTFVLSVKDGEILNGCYRAIFAYKEDLDAAQASAANRSGDPVLLLLLPAARDGVIACIMAEKKPTENSQNEDLHVADFIGIVTITKVPGEEQKNPLVATEVSPQPWRIR